MVAQTEIAMSQGKNGVTKRQVASHTRERYMVLLRTSSKVI